MGYVVWKSVSIFYKAQLFVKITVSNWLSLFWFFIFKTTAFISGTTTEQATTIKNWFAVSGYVFNSRLSGWKNTLDIARAAEIKTEINKGWLLA